MGFPRRLLNEGEDVVLDLRPHWWVFAKPVASVVLLLGLLVAARDRHVSVRLALVAVLAIAVAWLLVRYARWATTSFVLTTDRLVYRAGVLAKHGREMPLERLNDIAVSQTLFERLIGAGDVLLESAGERGQQLFTDVRRPFEVQNAIYVEIERGRARDAARAAGHGGASSVPEQIEKLDELRRRGIITQAEFDAKKTQLLDRI